MAYTEDQVFMLWQKYEDIAMHFNELIIRLRTQAVGGIAAIITLSGLALNFTTKSTTNVQWGILFGTLFFLLLAWVAIWIIDMAYYNKLLRGAVQAIIELEGTTEGRIILSTKIEGQFGLRDPNKVGGIWAQRAFYLCVAVGLLGGIAYTGYQMLTTKSATKEKLEYHLERTSGDAMDLHVSPGKTTP